MIKIGIIKEGKIPVDHRVAFTPSQCAVIKERFSVDLVVQPSNVRAFKDEEYVAAGIALQEDLSDCDILFGVKEVPLDDLIPNKTYFFFSHTIKKQAYNQELLKRILANNIQLIDYECLKKDGQRIVAFGRFAGIVGAYNGLLTYGKKKNLFDLKPANQCKNIAEMHEELKKVKAPGIRILLTGGGRVAKGAMETLHAAGLRDVKESEYLNQNDDMIFIQLDSDAYNQRKDGGTFDFQDFYTNAQAYESTFGRFLNCTDLLVAGAYWDPKAPKLFSKEDVKKSDWRIDVIADITCDIDGSIPTTTRSTEIPTPVFDYDKLTGEELAPYSQGDTISVMAVDNLPCEVPLDASDSFGDQLINNVLPELLEKKNSTVIHEATITKAGKLNEPFSYLSDYAYGN